MAVYEDKETGELVHAYEFTGKNHDFIINKLIAHGIKKYNAIYTVGIMEEHDTIVLDYNGNITILPKSKFTKWYTPFTVKG